MTEEQRPVTAITQEPGISHSESTGQKSNPRGLRIDPVFCPPDVASPFDTVRWVHRTATIKSDSGAVHFEQPDCEVPESWSQLATNIVASKYFYGEVGTPQRESSVRQLVHRVCRTIADWGLADGYFRSEEDGERFYRELSWLCLHQHAAFNSPVWFNVGLYHEYGIKGATCNWRWDKGQGVAVQPENPYEYPQASACFIQSVQDNMEDIMELARSEAMLFKFGSGTGTDLSTLRSFREKLSGGGKPSGPLSFMRVYDQIAAVVKSGGKTRRAAKMQSLKVTHPDILEFIECKAKEENKARVLIQQGYPPEEAYSSVLFQNANLSVRVTDEFMQAVEADREWVTHWVTDPNKEGPRYRARDLMRKMAESAWSCGDPGVQYDSTVNRWNTCPNSGRINASNPCSEYMFLDDSACNLASVNLMKFLGEDGRFNVERFIAACRIVFVAQEILVDHGSYPTARIARNSHLFRPIGLGYTNLGSLLMASGMPYDSDAARGLCGAVTALLQGAACRTSTELAAAAGPFAEFEKNREPMLHVMEMHWEKVEQLEHAPEYLKSAARRLWDAVLADGRRYGFRNAQMTVLAPTGTISFMMDCDTTGIEPDFTLVKVKQLAGGGTLKIVNQTVPLALKVLGYSEEQIREIVDYVDKHGGIEGAPHLKPEHLPVFDCAMPPPGGKRYIRWKAHVLMMAAAQPFLSGAISKTVNMPRDVTADEIANAYMEGWRLGLKALAVYRDGSKEVQPLMTKTKADKPGQPLPAPRRERLPDTRRSITHKFSVNGHEGYITVGLYPDGRPGELFITMAKEGSTVGGLMDCFGTAVSMSLQYGVPLEVYVSKFSYTRFEPMGFTKNPEIRTATSIVDYIFRWLGITFLPGYREKQKSVQKQLKEISSPGVAANGSNESNSPVAGQGSEAKPDASAAGDAPNDPWMDLDGGLPPILHPLAESLTGSGNGQPQNSGNGSPVSGRSPVAAEVIAPYQDDGPPCDYCGTITQRCGTCFVCPRCGHSLGCG